MTPTTAALQMVDQQSQKGWLRTDARARRAAIPALARAEAAAAVAAHSDRLPLMPHQTVGLYWPLGTELDTVPLMQKLHAAGYPIALPRASTALTPLRFSQWMPDQPLELDCLGIPAPIGTESVSPDLLLVPLLAYDKTGMRLGQGAGCYDRTLAALRQSNPALKAIGLAFACQEMDRLPQEPHDQCLDGVLTETGFTAFAEVL